MIVSDTEHEPCIQDFTPTQLGGSVVPQMNCYAKPRGSKFETHVRAQRQNEEVTRHTLSQAEMTTVPGTFGDPLRVIQNLPGVARIPYGIGQLVVRGSAPQDSSTFVDGQRVPILYHFLGGPSVLTPSLIDKIDFYPGGFGVHYGRATAGVLDVTTKSDLATQLHGNADLNLLDASGSIEGPLGGGVTGGLAARHSYIDQWLPLVIPQKQGSTTLIATPVYWDYQARLAKELGNAGKLSLFVFGSNDTLHVLDADPSRGNLDLGTHIGFHRAVATWTVTKDGWVSKLSPSYGFETNQISLGAIGIDAGAQVVGLREDLSKPINSKLTLMTGYDGQLRLEDLHFHIPIPNQTRTFGRTQPNLVDIDRNFPDAGNALYARGALGSDQEPAHRARHPRRLVPLQRHRSLHLRPAHRRALVADADVRAQGRRRHLSPAAGAAGAGLDVRQPEAQTDLGRPVPLRLREALHRRDHARHDVLLRAAAQPAGDRSRRALPRHRKGARLRHGAACCATRSRATSSAGSRTRCRAPSRRRARSATSTAAACWARSARR